MTLASSTLSAARRRPAWLTALAFVGTWLLAQALECVPAKPPKPENSAAPDPGPRHWALWKRVAYCVYEEFFEDRVMSLAGGVTFFVLLAMVPAITALVSIYALVADPVMVQHELSSLQRLMPSGSFDVIQQQVSRIVSSSGKSLGIWFFFGLAVSIWSANSGMKSIIDALNIVYGVNDERSFIRLNMVSLAMTLASVIGLIVAMAALVALPLVINDLPFGSFGKTLANWVRWPTLLALLMVGLAVLYRFGPNRENPRWEWVSPGNIFGAIAWLAGSALLSWYLGNFANYNATYGSLGAAVGLMMWLWISSMVVLVGAEINSEYYAARANVPKPHANKIGRTSSD